MTEFREVDYSHAHEINKHDMTWQWLLTADIGGTNTNFGLFRIKPSEKKIVLVHSYHVKSKTVEDMSLVVKDLLAQVFQRHEVKIEKAVFAAAGPLYADRRRVKPTNLPIMIDLDKIQQITGLSKVCLANDFEVIGYGIEFLDPKEIVCVKEGNERPRANKAIVGAGTGLGKALMVWHDDLGRYAAAASEGGHADVPVFHEEEFHLIKFIQRVKTHDCPVSWEDVLSGDGIIRTHRFYYEEARNNGHKVGDENGPRPDEIFARRLQDQQCWDTYQTYTRFYGRCAKNYTLETLALGGVYIAGGIAAKNVSLFEQELFLYEFGLCGKQAELLKEVPVFVIADYNVSLLGAAAYAIECAWPQQF